MKTIRNIVFDLETIPGEHKPDISEVSVPSNYKNPETIAKYQQENVDKQWRDQAKSFIHGRIHTIAWKVDTEPTQSIWHDGTDEEGLMHRWEEALVKTFEKHYGSTTLYGVTWVNHFIQTFDMPFVWLRARKYKCKKLIKMLGESPRDIKMEDTARWVVLNNYGKLVSLDDACKLFGLPGKGDFNGSMVCDAWLRGENEKIGLYGKDDVDKTYNLAVALGIIEPE